MLGRCCVNDDSVPATSKKRSSKKFLLDIMNVVEKGVVHTDRKDPEKAFSQRSLRRFFSVDALSENLMWFSVLSVD